MSRWTGRALRSAILGLVLTLAGLAHRTVLLHTDVKPHFEPYASYFLEARGWPFAWLVTEPTTDRLPLDVSERLLVFRFLFCWAGATMICGAIFYLVRKLG